MRCIPVNFVATLRRAALLCAFLETCCVAICAAQPSAVQDTAALRVCADPADLPSSNDKGEGYENKIAAALAHDLGRHVEYTFFPQRIGFVRNTLRMKDEQTQQFKCDVIIGVPRGYELTATTQPYMHSTYALVFAARDDFNSLKNADDLLKLPPETLNKLRIGVFTRSPGVDWLLKHSLMEHAVPYSHQTGDANESPGGVIGHELAARNIDAAIVWGPIAGMLLGQAPPGSHWSAVPFNPSSEFKFDYEISMGVRFGEKNWKDTLDRWISDHQREIDAILTSYRVPLIDASGKVKQ